MPLRALADLPAGAASGVLFFHSATCGPCQAMVPHVRELSEARGDVYSVDVAEHLEVATALGVRATPTVMRLREGRVVASHVGALSRGALSALVDAAE